MKNRPSNIAQHGVDAKSSTAPTSRLSPELQRFAVAHEIFRTAAAEACSLCDAAPFLLGALHVLEQLAGAPAPTVERSEVDLMPDDVLREQIMRHEPGDQLARTAHRLAWLLTDAGVFELPEQALSNLAALADDVAAGSDDLYQFANAFRALAEVRSGPGGQDLFASAWASNFISRYRARPDVAEDLAERMAQLADELRQLQSPKASANAAPSASNTNGRARARG